MYREIVKRDNNIILLVISLVFFSFICISSLDLLMVPYKILFQLFAVLVLGIACFIIIRFNIMDYKYSLIERDFIVSRTLGSREDLLFSISVDSILIVAPSKSVQAQKFNKFNNKINLCGALFSKKKYIGVYHKDDKLCKFCFEPSGDLLRYLKTLIPNKVYEK